MKFEKKDLLHCNNLVMALKKAEYKLDGMEILAFAEMMKWVNYLHKTMTAELSVPEPVTAPEPVQAQPAPQEPTKTKKKTRKE